MKYIFINPVVDSMYKREELNKILSCCGYERVEVKTQWGEVVRQKYNEVLKQTDLAVLDKRCPIVIDKISKYLNNQEVLVPDIEPILMHCAMELAERKDLIDRKKIITTPCESLADYGNSLKLEDTIFISWKSFLKELETKVKLNITKLENSPIPLGFFTSLEAKTDSISGKEEIDKYFKTKSYRGMNLVEMLYCSEGCHNGDGVSINE